jgi:hypothetical protein
MMTRAAALAAVISLACLLFAAATPSVKITQLTEKAEVYQLVSATLQVNAVFKNPFNYSDIVVQGQLTSPDGSSSLVDAFYLQPYERSVVNNYESLQPAGPSGWVLRFSPTVSGNWRLVVTVVDSTGSGTGDSVNFAVADPTDPRGFISPAGNRQHFQFDNGASYYPIGENICWPNSNGYAPTRGLLWSDLSDIA